MRLSRRGTVLRQRRANWARWASVWVVLLAISITATVYAQSPDNGANEPPDDSGSVGGDGEECDDKIPFDCPTPPPLDTPIPTPIPPPTPTPTPDPEECDLQKNPFDCPAPPNAGAAGGHAEQPTPDTGATATAEATPVPPQRLQLRLRLEYLTPPQLKLIGPRRGAEATARVLDATATAAVRHGCSPSYGCKHLTPPLRLPLRLRQPLWQAPPTEPNPPDPEDTPTPESGKTRQCPTRRTLLPLSHHLLRLPPAPTYPSGRA